MGGAGGALEPLHGPLSCSHGPPPASRFERATIRVGAVLPPPIPSRVLVDSDERDVAVQGVFLAAWSADLRPAPVLLIQPDVAAGIWYASDVGILRQIAAHQGIDERQPWTEGLVTAGIAAGFAAPVPHGELRWSLGPRVRLRGVDRATSERARALHAEIFCLMRLDPMLRMNLQLEWETRTGWRLGAQVSVQLTGEGLVREDHSLDQYRLDESRNGREWPVDLGLAPGLSLSPPSRRAWALRIELGATLDWAANDIQYASISSIGPASCPDCALQVSYSRSPFQDVAPGLRLLIAAEWRSSTTPAHPGKGAVQ